MEFAIVFLHISTAKWKLFKCIYKNEKFDSNSMKSYYEHMCVNVNFPVACVLIIAIKNLNQK